MRDIPQSEVSIRQAAEFSGLSEDTIRYYEKIGLLPHADRKSNGHRTYNKRQLEGMVFLTRLKATGMTLDEMKRYRALTAQGDVSVPERISILQEHRQRLQDEIARLMDTERIIDYKIGHYREILLNPSLDNTHCDAK